jgi:hypothetical protein
MPSKALGVVTRLTQHFIIHHQWEMKHGQDEFCSAFFQTALNPFYPFFDGCHLF